MDDREMLEAAAKAAGFTVHGWINDRFIVNFGDGMRGEWSPLSDDGDALRLAVKLMLPIVFGANYVILDGNQSPSVNNANDPYLATRRAIVSAAAAIGKEGK